MTPLSDIDVAVLFVDAPSHSVLQALKDELSGVLEREADVIVLNDASPILRMQVLRYGILVHQRNRRHFRPHSAKIMWGNRRRSGL
jgi:predicted nucleotidyltransferase